MQENYLYEKEIDIIEHLFIETGWEIKGRFC